MRRNWEATLPSCKPIIMLGNEPNSIEPYGHTESPENAAEISKTYRSQCPNSWFIVGNVALPEFLGIPGLEWLQRYVAAGGEYNQLGIHGYVTPNGSAALTLSWIDAVINSFPGVSFCVTEFNTFNRSPAIFAELLSGIRGRVGCYAAFTDRDPNWREGYGTNLDMIDASGNLNAYGVAYTQAQP
jgi:hypothetical protein